jgi:dienelactone hydrolase
MKNYMHKIIKVLSLSLFTAFACDKEITPYKLYDHIKSPEDLKKFSYKIPASSRFIAKRKEADAPDIVYYMTRPKIDKTYPIAILCGGSTSKEDIVSIIHFHRYFLKEFLDLGVAVLTVEQWGVDGPHVDEKAFMKHYTRSRRLQDYCHVIEHLQKYPPKGWNGKLVFLGVSEGGPIVNTLTTKYPDITLATINWCGAGNHNWREELWQFMTQMAKDDPNFTKENKCDEHHIKNCGTCAKHVSDIHWFREKTNETLKNPTPHKTLYGMTYMYHADALTYPPCDYPKIKTPVLIVAGTKDPIIKSCDAFVKKAQKLSQGKITYLRVDDMDHYVRKRQDILDKSFEWLKTILDSTH